MISRDELALLQQKLVERTNQREEYSNQIEEKKKELEELNTILQKISTINDAIASDEELQNRELSEAAAEVHNFKPESFLGTKWNIFDRDEKKISKLESTIAQLEEKLEKVTSNCDDLLQKDQANEDSLYQLNKKAEKASNRLAKLRQLSSRIPPPAPVLNQLEDLEDTNNYLKKSNKEAIALIPDLKKRLDSLEEQVQTDSTDLELVTMDLQTSTIEVDQHKDDKNDQFAQLQKTNLELQSLNVQVRTENDNSSHEISINDELSIKQTKDLTEIRKKILNLKTQMSNFNDQKKAAYGDNATLLNKKKQLCDQLEKKLSEERQILIEKQSNTSEVQDLTTKLEKLWIEHEKMVQQHENKKKQLEKAKDDLNRKNIAIMEINSKWPIDGKVKTKPGMNELNHMYEIALIQNRKMADDLNTLQEELAVQEEMNKTLKENLDLNSTTSNEVLEEDISDQKNDDDVENH